LQARFLNTDRYMLTKALQFSGSSNLAGTRKRKISSIDIPLDPQLHVEDIWTRILEEEGLLRTQTDAIIQAVEEKPTTNRLIVPGTRTYGQIISSTANKSLPEGDKVGWGIVEKTIKAVERIKAEIKAIPSSEIQPSKEAQPSSSQREDKASTSVRSTNPFQIKPTSGKSKQHTTLPSRPSKKVKQTTKNKNGPDDTQKKSTKLPPNRQKLKDQLDILTPAWDNAIKVKEADAAAQCVIDKPGISATEIIQKLAEKGMTVTYTSLSEWGIAHKADYTLPPHRQAIKDKFEATFKTKLTSTWENVYDKDRADIVAQYAIDHPKMLQKELVEGLLREKNITITHDRLNRWGIGLILTRTLPEHRQAIKDRFIAATGYEPSSSWEITTKPDLADQVAECAIAHPDMFRKELIAELAKEGTKIGRERLAQWNIGKTAR